MKDINDEQLLDFIDGTLSQSENDEIKNQIKTSNALNKRYTELLEVHQLLANKPLRKTSDQFIAHLIHDLDHQRSRFRKSGFILLLAGLSIVIISSIFLTDFVIDLNIKPLKLQEIKLNMPEGVDLKQLNMILLSVLSFISLLLFEKTILKPLFKR